MRIPKINKYRLERADKPETSVLEVDIRPEEYYDNLDIFENDKEISHFIIRSKYLIRGSYEYKKLIKFLKKYRGMYCCGIHNNLTTWDGFPIEVHHTPFTLEDIVYIVLTKRYKREESICMSDIADEVMVLHYMGLVGLYPLCSTCHEYAHGPQNDLFIPMRNLFGEPEIFYDIYKDFVSDMLQAKFENLLTINDGYNILTEEVPEGLIKKYIQVVNKGQEVSSVHLLHKFIDTYLVDDE